MNLRYLCQLEAKKARILREDWNDVLGPEALLGFAKDYTPDDLDTVWGRLYNIYVLVRATDEYKSYIQDFKT